jgi:DNA-directed RNA polymerase specialized sigma24 family protein
LLRTTGWKIQDVWRQNSRYVELTEATQEELAQQPAPVECDHEWLQHVRVTALDLLRESVSPQTYQIYDCLVLQEMPVKEVTQLFGVSRIRVDLVKFRCKRKLRKLVADIEDGITLGKALRISAFCDRKQGEHTS